MLRQLHGCSLLRFLALIRQHAIVDKVSTELSCIHQSHPRPPQQLDEGYRTAGIGKIKTDVGTLKNPGAHTSRDTFAIGLICARAPIVNVAKALGDTIKMVEDHYMPWIEKMKEVQVEETSRAVADQLEKLNALKNKDVAKVIPIGGRK